MGVFWGMGKNVYSLWGCFINMVINQKVASKKLHQVCLKHTTYVALQALIYTKLASIVCLFCFVLFFFLVALPKM